MYQRGFATLEVILMVTVLGILSAIALPRFDSITISANTAKVQADLSTLDTAIAIYQMDNGKPPENIKTDLKNYIQDIDNLKPPSGKVYVNTGTDSTIDVTGKSYDLDTSKTRATLDSKTSDKFSKPSSSS